MRLPPDEARDLIASITALVDRAGSEDELIEVIADGNARVGQIRAGRRNRPYPWQRPHDHGEGLPLCTDDCWQMPTARVPPLGMWLQLGGRGTGKTEGAARYVDKHVSGPPCDPSIPGGHRVIIVAPTQGDAVEACFEGPTGLRSVNPTTRMTGSVGGRLMVRWTVGPGAGSRARLLGASNDQDVDRLRAAGNTCLAWFEELAAIRRLADALDISLPGLRIGKNPHRVASTTPKPRKELRALLGDTDVIVTRGRTEDAHGLDPAVLAGYEKRYAGTRVGRQELGGEILSDVPGALWIHDDKLRGLREDGEPDDRPDIESHRLPVGSVGWTSHNAETPLSFDHVVTRCVVSVDPNAGGGDEAGIHVIGSIGGVAYVLADLSGPFSSDRYARTAVQAYFDYGAEGIVLEKSGGDAPSTIIRSVTLDDGREGSTVPIFLVPTKVGKRLRAEPVQAVAQQGRIKYVGSFPETEDQLTSWVPDETADSPDRLDSFVHGVTYLVIRASAGTLSAATGRRIQRPGFRPS